MIVIDLLERTRCIPVSAKLIFAKDSGQLSFDVIRKFCNNGVEDQAT